VAEELGRQMTEAGVDHTMLVRPGALRGCMQTDPVYDEAAAERRWTEPICPVRRHPADGRVTSFCA
jgi:hypothetical protein